MVSDLQLAAAIARAERAESENARLRQQLVEFEARFERRTAELLDQLAKLTDRVTELTAAAARGKRKPAPPADVGACLRGSHR